MLATNVRASTVGSCMLQMGALTAVVMGGWHSEPVRA
jgi:hypothetical protein